MTIPHDMYPCVLQSFCPECGAETRGILEMDLMATPLILFFDGLTHKKGCREGRSWIQVYRGQPEDPPPTVHFQDSTFPPTGGKGCACACHDKGPIQPGCSACAASPAHADTKKSFPALSGSL